MVPVPLRRRLPYAVGFGGPGVPSSPPPPPPPSPPAVPPLPGGRVGTNLPLIARVIDETIPDVVRRFSEKASDPLNGLMRAGILVLLGPQSWTLRFTAFTTGLTADGRIPGSYSV